MIDLSWSDGDIATIRLNRPGKKNAMTPEMLDRLAAAVGQSREKARALVLCGEGDVFCSGFDLKMCLDDAGVMAALLKGLSKAILSLRHLPGPVIAAVHGAAIAGGCALLCGADVVITHDEAKLGYPVVRLGVSPAVNAPFLSQSMGSGAARARLLDTQLISGREALRLGLAHECMPTAAEVLPHAQLIASQLGAKPRPGMTATKQWVNELDGSNDAIRIEQALQASLGLVGSAEERERLTRAFTK